MSNRHTETEFVQAFREGEERAYDYFFRKYYSSLCFFAHKLLGNLPDAEDAVQDCFTKLWDRRTSFGNTETIQSFLYATVRNACVDRLRKKSPFIESAASLQDIASSQNSLEEIVRAELLREIYGWMHQLPPRMQQVFRMFYIDGLNYSQIARYFQTSPETVRKQKARALSLLKERFTILLLVMMLH